MWFGAWRIRRQDQTYFATASLQLSSSFNRDQIVQIVAWRRWIVGHAQHSLPKSRLVDLDLDSVIVNDDPLHCGSQQALNLVSRWLYSTLETLLSPHALLPAMRPTPTRMSIMPLAATATTS